MKNSNKQIWDNQAQKHKESHWASWGDQYAISLEIENISKYIKEQDLVLDVGCANGFSTFEQLERHKIKIYGVDVSPKMISFAQRRKISYKNGDCIFFSIGDVRKLDFEDDFFDVTYTTRVLINLSNWEEQIDGIRECIRVTKKGGTIILSEAFWEPLVLLNSLRTLKNLPSLVEHDFNKYLKKSKLELFLNNYSLRFEIIDFSSVYYIGSRFLRELITKADNYPGYTNPINKVFFELNKDYSGGGFGIQQACIIYK